MEEILSQLDYLFGLPPEDAIKAIQDMGIEVTWDWKESLKAIQENSFTVAKVAQADAVQEIKSALEKSFETGTTYKDFVKEIQPLMERRGLATKPDGTSWRWDNIYRTNMQSSYMDAKSKQATELIETFPFWQYDAISDSRTRPTHRALDGKILRADDPFWKSHTPPNGYRCRCSFIVLRSSQVNRLNVPVSKGLELKQYKPDEGFDKSKWTPDLSRYDSAIAKKLKSQI